MSLPVGIVGSLRGESSLFVGVEMGGGKVTKEGGIAFFSPH